MTFERWLLLGTGLVVLVFSLTRFGARLKPSQVAGAGAGLLILLVGILPATKISLLGNSVEPITAAKKDEIATSTALDVAVGRRLETLERKFDVLTSRTATQDQRLAAAAANAKAKIRYDAAAVAAERARRRYLRSLNPFVPAPVNPVGVIPCRALTTEKNKPITTEDGQTICVE